MGGVLSSHCADGETNRDALVSLCYKLTIDEDLVVTTSGWLESETSAERSFAAIYIKNRGWYGVTFKKFAWGSQAKILGKIADDAREPCFAERGHEFVADPWLDDAALEKQPNSPSASTPNNEMSSSDPAPPAHKRNFVNYISAAQVDPEMIDAYHERKRFEGFLDGCLARIGDAAPADGYAYNAHMGAFVRALDHAADEFIKAQQAYAVPREAAKRARDE